MEETSENVCTSAAPAWRRLITAPALFLCAALLLGAGVVLAFWVAPVDASPMGFSQKIFYFHAPIAETALVSFGVAFVAAVLGLRHGGVGRGDRDYQALEIAAVRLGLVFSGLVLATGMIWGRAAWGVWWAWEPRLTTFLLAVLVYAAYFVVRSAVEDGDRRATVGSVYAVIAFVTVPITFFATRYLPEGLHPVVITASGAGMEGRMALAFAVCTAGMLVLLAALLRLEMMLAATRRGLEELKNDLERPSGGMEADNGPEDKGRTRMSSGAASRSLRGSDAMDEEWEWR